MDSSPHIGRTLGPYRILEKIGHGGMGTVYKGIHVALERHVAIKLLESSPAIDDSLRQRFQREAKAAAGLRHPNIVQVFDFGFQDGVYYLVMEYVQGTDLRAEIDRRRHRGIRFTPQEVLHILGQVADALDYAHERGVIHRDVKPANILLTPDSQAFLGDFGLAMFRDRVSQMTLGHSFGTPEYIAPEQAIDSRAALPQSDTYSLGGILYEMVTGHLPFEAETSISLALKHISEEPAPPSRYVPTLPKAVEGVILKALSKEPANRFATGRGMIEALRRAWAEAPAQPTATSSVLTAASVQPAGSSAMSSPSLSVSASPTVERSAIGGAAMPFNWRRAWPWIAGVVVLVIIGVAIGLASSKGGPPFAAAVATRTNTAIPATATSVPTLTALPTNPPPTFTAEATVAPTVIAIVLPSPSATATDTPAPAPTASALPTLTRTPMPSASPTASRTPAPTSTPTLAPGQALTRTVDGMAMRFVPGGVFLMGASSDDEDAQADEKPQHEVNLSSFWMDKTEVTNAQYRLCVDAEVCSPPIKSKPFDAPERANYPVVYVTWEHADSYCRWLATKTGWNIRLPTEAQWEKAASWDPSANVKRLYPWGNAKPDKSLLNYQGSYLNDTVPVGSYPAGASVYGILDMAGNVWEWVADYYDGEYYKTPNFPRDPSGPAYGRLRVMRGGSFGYGSADARATNRESGDPALANGDGLGFRCVVNGERLP